MGKLLTSIIIGLCVFLGTISAQQKAFALVDHIGSDHAVSAKSHHHHHSHSDDHDHHHEHKDKSQKSKDHNHTAELSTVVPSLYFHTVITKNTFKPSISRLENSFFYTEVTVTNFLDSIFRPPIA